MRTLLQISDQMKPARPVFIVGEARSGTSILDRTLQKHSAFRPREQNLVETEIFVHLRRTFMFRKSYPDRLRRFMLDDDEMWGLFLRSIRVVRVISALSVIPNLVLRDRLDWLWYGNLNHLLLRSYFFHAHLARGSRRLVEKTPTHTRYMDKLTRTFPKAQLLYIHRHPLDVFSSYRRRASADPGAAWAEVDAGEFCEAYEESTERVLTWIKAGHGNLLMVRYESFTADPESELRRVCDFLSERFEAGAVEEPSPDLSRWRGDPLLWGPIVSQTKRWGDFLTSHEADFIQRRLAGVMMALEYEPYDVR